MALKAINVDGLEPIRRKMKQFEPKLQNKLQRRALRRAARPVRDRTQQTVPVDTGLLKRSIVIRALRRSRKRKTVGVRITTRNNEAFYIKFLETGTKYIRARHYMARALDDSSQEVLGIFKTEIAKYVDEEDVGKR